MASIEVQAQPDHLDSLTKVSPASALTELIWNSLDAEASHVAVLVQENAIHGVTRITIEDDGHGLPHPEAAGCFGRLGGSWKRNSSQTQHLKRALHGREGKGRFCAFSLGSQIQWQFRFRNNGEILAYNVVGKKLNLKRFDVDDEPKPLPGAQPGTTVVIEDPSDNLGVVSRDGTIAQRLCEVFAIYLRKYPYIRITVNGYDLDPQGAQSDSKTYPLPAIEISDGKSITAELDVIEWHNKRERKIFLCGEGGFALHEIEAKIRPGSEFNFTAHVRSPYIDELHRENRLVLEDIEPSLDRLIEAVRDKLRSHFREKKAKAAEQVVQEWKNEGIYPFSGESSDPIDTVRRQVFNIMALNVYEHLDDFRIGATKSKRFTLRMLRQALDENPASFQKILQEMLDLPQEKRDELSELLESTSLAAIIEASKLVTERLDFLKGLEQLLFHPDSKKETEERSQLHRILEKNTWIFGEEFNLTNSDESLTTVLKAQLPKLRSGVKIADVVRDDGRRAIIDMLLGQEVPQGHKIRKEYLVVELKRPSQKVDLDVKAQIESYALAVARDERFDKQNTIWTFLAVSNEISEDARQSVMQPSLPKGFFHVGANMKIGLVEWNEILNSCRTRLELYREKLGYEATANSGVELLRKRYEEFLPSSMKTTSLEISKDCAADNSSFVESAGPNMAT